MESGAPMNTQSGVKAVELRSITKYFPGVIANNNVDLDLNWGEVLALLGENGAGKTTLMNILYGLYAPDAGEIYINGALVSIRSPQDAMRYGIGMIHQHFTLVPVHSVVENVMLGGKAQRRRAMRVEDVAREIEELGNRYGLEVDPFAIVGQLPVGVQQRVEILKALYRGAQVLIMDEPTAVLTPQETRKLFSFIREFKEKGNAVIFISHKLAEVMEIADRITVLRNGKVVGTLSRTQASERRLAYMMVGRELKTPTRIRQKRTGRKILEVKDLVVKGDRGNLAVDHLSLEICQGEIFGIAGVSGNGQEELAEAICGLRQVEGGKIILDRQEITNANPLTIIKAGVGYIPSDRRREGLVLDMSVEENIILRRYFNPEISSHGIVHRRVVHTQATKLVREFTIKTPSLATKAKALSGGNQQKLVVAREYITGSKVLVAVQPTRGLDVGAAEYVQTMLSQASEEGKAILLISTELAEILALSDRIGVIYRGKLLEIIDRAEATVEKIGLLMAGIRGERNAGVE